ncbi:MAG TPA: response regulator [Polyangia bacterium]|nr:response regulator [Polyangia bacterium]
MNKDLRVLLCEDSEDDAALLTRALRQGGYNPTVERVETAEAMTAALASPWDIIISDYSMPQFDAPSALAVVKERGLDLPFIIVSGTIDEEVAVDAMRAGAQDFMTKGKFARLIPAIERELRESGIRSERRKMQEQLMISDRMASVGTLAAGVAHEINNPLAALMANLDLVAQDFADHRGEWSATRLQEMEESLRDARECADRVRHIVKDLKIFSRSDDDRRGAVDVHRVLESSLRMAWNEIRHRARLVKDYGDVPFVDANEARLGQVFLNLIVNAAQAIPEGNTDKNEIRVVTKRADNGDGNGQVVVEVRDTGSGIPEAVLSKIFDPFFTTKPIGVGTGLGLAICHRIVLGMGGRIDVDSEVGKGTSIRITLPIAKAIPAEVTPPPVAVPTGRRGRILIVDDEPMLGGVIRRMLAGEHDLQVVTTAREAIELLKSGERFDAILSDLMMPEITGMDLHAALAKMAPDQADRIVFMTGGAFTTRAREFLGEVRNARLEKPFDVNTLRALIYSLLR